ncbi:MAG TPA: tripartite tricarboxylate transporter substrate binding protein [Usitatibacteraceae bacterium]|jgi:putative tricarboxylic transport membrane protein|nr:tripartite tricarboxylate transporter substrate binding protein [Usitatibacteraceae bacterium]
MRNATRFVALTAAATLTSLSALAAIDKPECIVGAKPGGGFDLTCKLATQAMQDLKLLKDPMRSTYMPGGIGAVAMNAVVAQRAADPNVIVAFSGGSLLNIAQGKFGKWTENDVRWVAAVGADYGSISVGKNAPWKSLAEVAAAMKADPSKVPLGGGGTVGSQDWTKAAMLAKKIGIDPKAMRWVSFEGNGEATTALMGGHIQVMFGDVSADEAQAVAGNIRTIAVLADKRLEGKMGNVPTAKEQGYDLQWPIIRGFYTGPKVADPDYKAWQDMFKKAMATKEFAALREQRGLQPFDLTGAELDAYVKKQVGEYRKIAEEFGLGKK